MADQPQKPAATQLAFPPPPEFYKLYREDADGTAERPFPPEPPEPVQGEYEMFGELHTVSTAGRLVSPSQHKLVSLPLVADGRWYASSGG